MTDARAGYVRSDELLSRGDTRLLVVDLQERLVPVIAQHEHVVANGARLLKTCRLLDVPVSATEQYPKGLGSTVSTIADQLDGVEIVEKLRFSSVEAIGWGVSGEGDSADRDKVVVVGIETHVCVLQTVFDLLSLGYRVHVPADAVGSRAVTDHDRALQRMRDAGAVVTTTETVLFELCEAAGTPAFKAISQLVKDG